MSSKWYRYFSQSGINTSVGPLSFIAAIQADEDLMSLAPYLLKEWDETGGEVAVSEYIGYDTLEDLQAYDPTAIVLPRLIPRAVIVEMRPFGKLELPVLDDNYHVGGLTPSGNSFSCTLSKYFAIGNDPLSDDSLDTRTVELPDGKLVIMAGYHSESLL